MELNKWRYESLRLTTFHSAPFDLKATSPWELVLGEAPESTTINLEGRQELKEVDGHLLSCKMAGDRMDWFYSSKIPLEGENGGLGEATQALEKFHGFVSDWVQKAPIPITRVAFGGVAYIPVATKRDGYLLLDQLLPGVTIDPDGSSDFQYRINRPRKLTIESGELAINRISGWALRRIEIGNLALGTPLVRVERVSCEVDINSPADLDQTFDSSSAKFLMETFMKWGMEVLERGDIA